MRAGSQRKMADGVDHIDIYADVEEEFSQVINTYFPTSLIGVIVFNICIICYIYYNLQSGELLWLKRLSDIQGLFNMLQACSLCYRRALQTFVCSWGCRHLTRLFMYLVINMHAAVVS